MCFSLCNDLPKLQFRVCQAKPFLSGFVPNAAGKEVYGRMVGVAVVADGALLISDDGKLSWRIRTGPTLQTKVPV